MKYLILNQRGGINAISNTAPVVAADERAVEVSDEVAAQATTMIAARQAPLWLDGALTSRAAQLAAGIRLRWDDAAKVWTKTAVVVPVRVISKLAIRRQLREWGKEDAFESLLDGFPHARTDWNDAAELKSDDPLFVANRDAFKAALTLTDEQFTALMNLR